MSGLFENLEVSETERSKRVSGARVKTAAAARASKRFASYISNSSGIQEREQRLSLISDELLDMVTAACNEHGYDDSEGVLKTVVSDLRNATCGCDHSEGKDCDCKGCSKCKESNTKTAASCPECAGSGQVMDAGPYDYATHCEKCNGSGKVEDTKEAATKTAEGVSDTSYQNERVKLPSSDSDKSYATGLGSDPSPEMDESQVPDGGLGPIEVDSVRNELENQSVRQKPDWGNRHDGPENPDPTNDAIREQVDAGKSMQSEFNVAPNTDTWSDKGTQQEAVTSASKWSVVSANDPLS